MLPTSLFHHHALLQNILLESNGEPLLTDFGSVRLAMRPISSRSLSLEIADEAASLCTVSYRAPELFDPPVGTTLDTRTDVWALGCLLFASWHGYSPYECIFADDRPRVVECSHSRVLNGIPVLQKPSKEDSIVHDLCTWILQQDMLLRPHNSDLISRVENFLNSLQVGVASMV